jgi:hypothetical protein
MRGLARVQLVCLLFLGHGTDGSLSISRQPSTGCWGLVLNTRAPSMRADTMTRSETRGMVSGKAGWCGHASHTCKARPDKSCLSVRLVSARARNTTGEAARVTQQGQTRHWPSTYAQS